MKKLFMTIMLTAGLYGLVSGQIGQSQSSQSRNDRSTTMQNDKDKMDGWEKIGEKTVDLNQDKGIFNWDTDREKSINANEKYSALKFKAKDATVNMTNVEVEFEDGKKQNLSIAGIVKANSESKVVQLESDDKKLDKVTFNYKKDATAGAGKVKVELWGLKADGSSGMGRRSNDIKLDEDDRNLGKDGDTAILDRKNPGTRTRTQTGIDRSDTERSGSSQSQNDRSTSMQKVKDKMDDWEKIGEKTVDLKQDKSIFNWDSDREKTINANEKYSALKFKAKDATINMTNVEVEFEDGKKQNLSISGPVNANSESKVVQLESDDRKLDKVTFNYKKDATASADKVKVELWGLKADGSSGMGRRSLDIELDENDSNIGDDRDTAILDRKNPGTNTRTDTKIDIDRSDAERSGTKNDRGRRSTTIPVPR